MPDSIEDLTFQHQRSVRAHYVSGHFTLDEALQRLRVGGWYEINAEQAADVLSRPILAATVRELTGRDVTEEQIAARLAEVYG
jgi:hypothetical protein